MVDEDDLKLWKDAGHVARRTLESIKEEIKPGVSWHEVIEKAERYIIRHGGKPAFPATIAVNDVAAHYTTDHNNSSLFGWEDKMVFEKGQLVKLDVGVQIQGRIGDNALTLEVGNGANHTEQIRASKESRDSAISNISNSDSKFSKADALSKRYFISSDIDLDFLNGLINFLIVSFTINNRSGVFGDLHTCCFSKVI